MPYYCVETTYVFRVRLELKAKNPKDAYNKIMDGDGHFTNVEPDHLDEVTEMSVSEDGSVWETIDMEREKVDQ